MNVVAARARITARMRSDNQRTADVVIVGAGVGGATVARTLAGSGLDVLVVERGGFLPLEAENFDAGQVFGEGRYKTRETWLDSRGAAFRPSAHYFVGGNSKVYGAALVRFRASDFDHVDHQDGPSPAWPLRHDELEPHYAVVEQWYRVHGRAEDDPTSPTRRGSLPWPPIPHADGIERLRQRLVAQGLRPFGVPLAIDYGVDGTCRVCATCDGFPCRWGAKLDAEVACLLPASTADNVRVWTGARTLQVLAGNGDAVSGVRLLRDGDVIDVKAPVVVLAAGAVNSAALLLRSGPERHRGLANASGAVGAHYMQHLNSAVMSFGRPRSEMDVFQKTLMLTDRYGADGTPLGSAQLTGKITGPMLAGSLPWAPRAALGLAARHSVDWFATTEDLPRPENRVRIANDRIQVDYRPNNVMAHRALVSFLRRCMRRAGYPLTIARRMGLSDNGHQCGTVRMGEDRTSSVVDSYGRSHDVAGLVVADASVFPSSAAVNPALTVAAIAHRAGDAVRMSA